MMKKEEMKSELSSELGELKQFSDTLSEFVRSLQLTMQSDVAMNTLEQVVATLAKSKNVTKSLEKTKKVLKLRAQTRMKEIT
jgi:hypothetical protein